MLGIDLKVRSVNNYMYAITAVSVFVFIGLHELCCN